ncbi:MAG: hypothetical protein AAFR60_11155, partial [Pseudomonadota bacterium]
MVLLRFADCDRSAFEAVRPGVIRSGIIRSGIIRSGAASDPFDDFVTEQALRTEQQESEREEIREPAF